MNKFLKSAIVVIAFSPLGASAENFTGAYGGVGFGINALSSEYRQSAFNSFNSTRTNTAGMLYNATLFAGYGKMYEQFYVGGELAASLTTGNAQGGKLESGDPPNDGKFLSKWTIHPALRLGMLISPKTLAYGKIGVSDTHFEVNSMGGTDSNGQSYKYKKNIWGFSMGAGLETLLTDKVSFRMDYTFSIYPKKTWTVGGGPTPDSAKISPKESIFRVGVAYYF